MQRSVRFPRLFLITACLFATIFLAMPSAWAVNVNIDEVTIELDSEKYTSDDVEYIYVNSELAEITLSFSLDATAEDADWTLTLGASTNVTDQEFQSGKFSSTSTSTSTSFTPRDVNLKLGDQNADGDLVYSFKLTLQVTATTTEETTTNDGDEDVTTSETVTNTSPTQTINIVVDRDPPATAVLDDTLSSGGKQRQSHLAGCGTLRNRLSRRNRRKFDALQDLCPNHRRFRRAVENPGR